MEFKDIIKEFLLDKNLSQESFAKSIGTTQGTVSKWISGVQEPRYSQLRAICKAYDFPAEVLLGLKEY